MNIFTPTIPEETTIISLNDHRTISEIDTVIDLQMLAIEEAGTHFDDPADSEKYWAGRLLADRKTTRFAA
jgi:hypothetical protein